MGKKSPTWTEESVTAWLKENLVHINLVEYAGHSERPSIFVNTVTGDEFETKFRILLSTVRKGAPKDWQPQAINWNQRLIARWLERHSETTRLVEYAGNAKGLSTFKSAETGEEYQSAWYSLMKSVKEKGPQYNYLESTVTEEAARKWCEENLKHWELLEYGGTTNSDSKWLCTLNGEEYTRPLNGMKDAHKLYGYEYKPRTVQLNSDYVAKWCEENTDYVRLVEYGGQANVRSKWMCLKQQACFSYAFAELKRVFARHDRTYTFDVSPGWRKYTEESLKLKISTMYENMELLEYGGNLLVNSTWKEKTTGKIFKRPMVNMYRPLRNYGTDYTLAGNKLEKVIEDMLIREGIEYIHNQEAAGRRYDFLLPEHRVIIECDGLYWHSEATQEDREYHRDKRQAYVDAGYRPLFFRSNEITENRDLVFSLIRKEIGIATKVTRDEVMLVTPTDVAATADFLSNNSFSFEMQGTLLCGTHNDEIVLAATIDEGRILSLYVSATHHIDSAYDLVADYIQRRYACSSVEYIGDLRFIPYDSSISHNFTVENTVLDYYWTDTLKAFSKKQVEDGEVSSTKLHRIWDCGQRKYVKHYG